MPPTRNILGYAFGLTHDQLTRLMSLARRLIAFGDIEVHLVSNQMLAARQPLPGVTYYQCPPEGKAIVAKLHELIERIDPQLLLVDTFPLGIANELPQVIGDFACPCVLIEGFLPHPSAQRADLGALAARLYDFSIAPADILPYRQYGRALNIEPIVCYEPAEMTNIVDARTQLRQTVKPIFLFHEAAGLRTYERLRRECTTSGGLRIEWRLATQDTSLEARFPGECQTDPLMFRLHTAVALVVAPPTYSFVHEAMSSGVPALFTPARGPLEPTNRRAGPLLVHDEGALIKRIHDGDVPDSRAPTAYSGARRAASFLRQYIGRRRPRKLTTPQAA